MKRALFLDRDGVINVDKKYVHKIEDFEFCEGIFELCQIFMQKDYLIFVITNQSGIARGYYGEEDFAKLSTFMCEEFAKKGIFINKIYHCPHLEGCECRKPKPGMFFKAYEEYDIDRKNSLFIGDNLTDMQAGLKAGLKKLYLINPNQKGDFFHHYANLNALLSDIKKGEICV
ncbi:HAD family hydrolase [Campylobacter vulpis]|uniref:D,D-heptose 1,7-bisphosphate phosphatase n=1 Tax=Campylobacter vulpis TaxID=1655500 RepID=A0ABS5P4J5_9BACT|nr:HAD family hydrolase [Campylobacter vulpis]MBS4241570.1 HAD family hydrolase [Campylobacter vulpis]MBS4252406.1 HAD family hydrolase [Campylobacter vulpis]MBS4281683.1 HAD family hydrolase [Campylobacter vulpis]MBS4407485.1 HAD family hydrolase [Campylobacter vulpis]